MFIIFFFTHSHWMFSSSPCVIAVECCCERGSICSGERVRTSPSHALKHVLVSFRYSPHLDHLGVHRYNPDLTSATSLKTVQWGAGMLSIAHHTISFSRALANIRLYVKCSFVLWCAQTVWSLGYTFSPPISPRTATFLTTTHLETVTPRIGWGISIPFDVGNDDLPLCLFVEAGVKSSTVCVDRFRELEGGKVEWLYVFLSLSLSLSLSSFVFVSFCLFMYSFF